jgi:hypothetical protein
MACAVLVTKVSAGESFCVNAFERLFIHGFVPASFLPQLGKPVLSSRIGRVASGAGIPRPTVVYYTEGVCLQAWYWIVQWSVYLAEHIFPRLSRLS